MSDSPITTDVAAHSGDWELPSVFHRIVILGWYDGPTSGVASHNGTESYRFDLLAWDDSHEVRIFALRRMSDDSFGKLVDLLRPYDQPQWPLWVAPWRFPSEKEEKNVQAEIERIVGSALQPTYAIATRDLTASVLAGIRLDGDQVAHAIRRSVGDSEVEAADTHIQRYWFTALGLNCDSA